MRPVFQFRQGVLSVLLGLLLCAVGPASNAQNLPEIQPHRAVYEISLSDKSLSSAQPASLMSLSGRMVYEMSGSDCEGYSTAQRLVTSAEMAESDATIEDVQMAGFEDPLGSSYQFVTRTLVDQRLIQSLKGAAKVESGQTKLTMQEPREGDLVLENEVLFPVRWFRELLAAAKRGERLFSAYQFDGSDKVGEYFQTTVTIGPERMSGEKVPVAGMAEDMKRWSITAAYFLVSQGPEQMSPAYEISTTMYENGVSGSLFLNFENYALEAKLQNVELLSVPSCN